MSQIKWRAELIVLGSHDYGRLKGIVLGSVALGVLAEAPCSVLVARIRHVTNGHESKAVPAVTVCH